MAKRSVFKPQFKLDLTQVPQRRQIIRIELKYLVKLLPRVFEPLGGQVTFSHNEVPGRIRGPITQASTTDILRPLQIILAENSFGQTSKQE